MRYVPTFIPSQPGEPNPIVRWCEENGLDPSMIPSDSEFHHTWDGKGRESVTVDYICLDEHGKAEVDDYTGNLKRRKVTVPVIHGKTTLHTLSGLE